MRATIICGLSLLALAGCATSSGVSRVGPDTYSITASSLSTVGGVATAKRKALDVAGKFCEEQGKQALIIENSADANLASSSSDLTFRCQ